MPSRSENFGHAIFEALCAGTPVLIGDRTPWQDLETAKAGFDIPLPDPAALAAAIDRLAAMTRAEYAEWRAGARAMAEQFVATSTARADMARLFLALTGLALLVVAGTAFFHVGVEHGWWEGSSACVGASTAGQTTEEMTATILNAPLVRCDTPAFVMFGISMAGYDAIYALALAALTLVGAKRSLAGRG